MKKITHLAIALFLSASMVADEGMWLVHLIGNKTYNDMVKRGLKLSKEQLYSINKSSIKDAIAIFGGGCTSEMVSPEGLLFTNHHCGYGSINAVSTVENNYLENGFWAKSKQEEIPCPGLSVQFLVSIADVTDSVNARIKDIKPEDLASKLPGVLAQMGKKAAEGTGYEVRISSFFKGNQFLQFSYQIFKDVRLVGTPPQSIGKFGGDTDNWEWPRHTGDFSIFRVYMSPDGKPAEHSKDNVPYKPKHFLPVSIKGLNDGDYAMIYGYPGGTNRYETSYGVQLKIDIENPTLVELRDIRLKAMHAEMIKDPKVKLQLASSYAGIANYWKFFDGETKQLIKHKVIEQKQKDEAAFEKWAQGNKDYDNLFTDIKKTYDQWRPYAKSRVYLTEGIMGSPLISFAASLNSLRTAMANKPDDVKKITTVLEKNYQKFIKNENVVSDRNILSAILKKFYDEVDPSQRPKAFYDQLESKYGPLTPETYLKFSNDIFAGTMLLDSTKFRAFLQNPDTLAMKNDPAVSTALAFLDNYNTTVSKHFADFNAQNFALNRKYQKGILEKMKGQTFYPDANFTMRISYGNVKSYSPRDAVHYKEICTLGGVMEKYKPGDYEFDLPEKLLTLIKNKDYGQYVDKKVNDVVVCFITNNDITGGNSGSPVLNAKGELIGLAFDGNYEALSHKIAFDGELNRTICLDVRYLLFVVEKLGGATNIINELAIRK